MTGRVANLLIITRNENLPLFKLNGCSSLSNETKGLYIQLFGQAWLFLTIKPLRHSTWAADYTVRVTKNGNVLPLYKIRVLLKTGGAGKLIKTRTCKIDVVIKYHLTDSIGSVVVKGEDFLLSGTAVRIPGWHYCS